MTVAACPESTRAKGSSARSEARQGESLLADAPPTIRARDLRSPTIYGISIYMYWNEGRHARPHFHARYGGQAASIDLDGDLIAGSLPRRARALVAEWVQLHRAELEANWERARRDDELEPSSLLAQHDYRHHDQQRPRRARRTVK